MMEPSDPRRKFPRIFLVGMHDLRELTGARVEWANAQRTDVLDMSYSGLAVVRPSGIEFEKGKILKVKVLYAGIPTQELQIELVRETEKIFGARFVNLTKQNLDAMDMFLSDKLLGKNLRTVNPKFFNEKHQFDHWLHGPNNTNLYIWMNDNKIKKAVFEFNGTGLVYDGQFALQKLNQNIDDDDDYVVLPITKTEDNITMEEFMSRTLKILSQVEDAPAPVWSLLDLIKEEAKK